MLASTRPSETPLVKGGFAEWMCMVPADIDHLLLSHASHCSYPIHAVTHVSEPAFGTDILPILDHGVRKVSVMCTKRMQHC